ncbi:MAG: hypothetical protein JSW34_05340, partial [Candidatus Zixiibacteriota bacterium]
RRLEGRFRLTSQYTGDRHRLDRSFSENYNVWLSYNPRNNLNMNLTYIYTDFSGTTATSFSSVTGYVSYTFRKAFSAYVSVNRQVQKRTSGIVDGDGLADTENRPRSLNAQILIYVSPKATLSVAYLRNEAGNVLGQEITNESVQAVFTIQI